MPFPPPEGLDLELVDLDGRTMLVFSWPTTRVDLAAPLTRAERAVLRAVAAGQSNAAIARVRRRSVRTVANQIASMLRKLGVRSRHELVAKLAGARVRDDPPQKAKRAKIVP